MFSLFISVNYEVKMFLIFSSNNWSKLVPPLPRHHYFTLSAYGGAEGVVLLDLERVYIGWKGL